MNFLHDGRPPVVREAACEPPPRCEPASCARSRRPDDFTGRCARRSSPRCNVCSKEWIIRQYDHEVQGGSVIKPLVGVANDGPGDAAVVLPVLGSPPRHGRSAAASIRTTATSIPTAHGRRGHRRGGAQRASPSGPIRRGSPCSTTSAGATPIGRRCSARWCGRPRPAATWPWR